MGLQPRNAPSNLGQGQEFLYERSVPKSFMNSRRLSEMLNKKEQSQNSHEPAKNDSNIDSIDIEINQNYNLPDNFNDDGGSSRRSSQLGEEKVMKKVKTERQISSVIDFDLSRSQSQVSKKQDGPATHRDVLMTTANVGASHFNSNSYEGVRAPSAVEVRTASKPKQISQHIDHHLTPSNVNRLYVDQLEKESVTENSSLFRSQCIKSQLSSAREGTERTITPLKELGNQ